MKQILILIVFIGIAQATCAKVEVCPIPGAPLPDEWFVDTSPFFNPNWDQAGELIHTAGPVITTLDNHVFESMELARAYMIRSGKAIKLSCAYRNLDPSTVIPFGVAVSKVVGLS